MLTPFWRDVLPLYFQVPEWKRSIMKLVLVFRECTRELTRKLFLQIFRPGPRLKKVLVLWPSISIQFEY